MIDHTVSAVEGTGAMHIMIVDDSKAMRMIVERTLRQAGFGACEFTEASNGDEALAAIERRKPDLVLSDTSMPVMTGLELLGSLRRRGVDVKLGFITSESTPRFRKQAADAGALFAIAKPFTVQDLCDALARAGISTREGGDERAISPARRDFPTPEEMAGLLSLLLLREVGATDSDRPFFDHQEPRIVADYVDDEGRVVGVTVCSLGFAGRAGAALSMVAPGKAEEAIAAGRIEGVLLDNLLEVVNVMVRFHNGGDRPHVRFRSISSVPGLLPADVRSVYSHPAARKSYDVSIQGYGEGRISLMLG